MAQMTLSIEGTPWLGKSLYTKLRHEMKLEMRLAMLQVRCPFKRPAPHESP